MKNIFPVLVIFLCGLMTVSAVKPNRIRELSKTIERREPSETNGNSESNQPDNEIVDTAVVQMRQYMEGVRDRMCNACLAMIPEVPVSPEVLALFDENTSQRTAEERLLREVIMFLVSLIDRMH